MDAETFVALHSTRAAALGPPRMRAASPRRGTPAIAEIVSRPPRRPTAPGLRSVAQTESRRARGRPAPPSSPAAAAAFEAEIDGCTSREHVARLAVHLARAYSPAAALFLVHRGMIERICGDGSAARGGRTPVSGRCLEPLRRGDRERRAVSGRASQDGFEDRILRALGRQHVQEIAVLPVAIRGRVVNLLYADNGPEALGDASVAALAAVCARVSRAYERLILERKAGAADPRRAFG